MADPKPPSLRRMSVHRYLSYLLISFLAALSYHCLIASQNLPILAFLLPITTTITASYLLQKHHTIPISYSSSVSLPTYLIGSTAHSLHLPQTHQPSPLSSLKPLARHALLAFALLSELEWYRPRFDQSPPSTCYTNLLTVLPFPYFYDCMTSLRRPDLTQLLLHGWKYILADAVFVGCFIQSCSWLYEAAKFVRGFDHSSTHVPHPWQRGFFYWYVGPRGADVKAREGVKCVDCGLWDGCRTCGCG